MVVAVGKDEVHVWAADWVDDCVAGTGFALSKW